MINNNIFYKYILIMINNNFLIIYFIYLIYFFENFIKIINL